MFQLGPFADTNGFMYRCKQTRGLDRRPKRPRKYAAELVALAPEVILAHSSAAVAPLLQATRTVSCSRLSPTRSVQATSFGMRADARTVAAFIHLAMIRIMLKRLVASSSS
jgi:hypothetical protein